MPTNGSRVSFNDGQLSLVCLFVWWFFCRFLSYATLVCVELLCGVALLVMTTPRLLSTATSSWHGIWSASCFCFRCLCFVLIWLCSFWQLRDSVYNCTTMQHSVTKSFIEIAPHLNMRRIGFMPTGRFDCFFFLFSHGRFISCWLLLCVCFETDIYYDPAIVQQAAGLLVYASGLLEFFFFRLLTVAVFFFVGVVLDAEFHCFVFYLVRCVVLLVLTAMQCRDHTRAENRARLSQRRCRRSSAGDERFDVAMARQLQTRLRRKGRRLHANYRLQNLGPHLRLRHTARALRLSFFFLFCSLFVRCVLFLFCFVSCFVIWVDVDLLLRLLRFCSDCRQAINIFCWVVGWPMRSCGALRLWRRRWSTSTLATKSLCGVRMGRLKTMRANNGQGTFVFSRLLVRLFVCSFGCFVVCCGLPRCCVAVWCGLTICPVGRCTSTALSKPSLQAKNGTRTRSIASEWKSHNNGKSWTIRFRPLPLVIRLPLASKFSSSTSTWLAVWRTTNDWIAIWTRSRENEIINSKLKVFRMIGRFEWDRRHAKVDVSREFEFEEFPVSHKILIKKVHENVNCKVSRSLTLTAQIQSQTERQVVQ